MKKFRLLNILLILTFVFTMPVVYAHEIPVDKNNIKVQDVAGTIYSGSKIEVDTDKIGFEEYELYYQYVIIENDAYESYMEVLKKQTQYTENFLKDNNLTKVEDASSDLKESYNAAIEGYVEEAEEKLPAYVEENWVESTDGTTKLDLTEVPENSLGYQPYSLWIKVVPKEDGKDAVYNDIVVTAKKQAADSELQEENASTGDNIMWIGICALALAGIMVVSYRKSNA